MTAGLTAGARDLVGEVRRFGLYSAATVVDRYVEIVDRAISRDGLAPAPAGEDTRAGWPADPAVQVASAWLRVLDATSALLRSEAPREPAATTLVPGRLDLLPAGTSREIRLRVVVPPGLPAACYLGMLLTSAAPAEPMVVRLEVAGSGP